MAGIIYGITYFSSDAQKSINFALAAAALKSTIPGDTNFVSAQEVLSMLSGNTTGRINR
jgi:2-dehydro-3-deoxygluconokinase